VVPAELNSKDYLRKRKLARQQPSTECDRSPIFTNNIVTFLFSKLRAFFSIAEMHALKGGSISATGNLSVILHADGIINTHETRSPYNP